MVASLAQAPLVPALPQQGGSVEPPESFAYLASQVRSLLVAQKEKQKAELAPHLPSNKSRLKKALLRFFLNARPPVSKEQLRPHVLVRASFRLLQIHLDALPSPEADLPKVLAASRPCV